MELDMTRGKALPLLLQFTLPLFIGNVFQQLYNMADTIIVGRFVGAGALAAVGSTGTIMFLLIGFAQGITSGFSVLTAQRYGAGDTDAVRRSVANGILLSVIIAVLLTTVSLITIRPILTIMNTPSDIYTDALTYIQIICIGLTANLFYNLFSSYLRAIGNSKMPLVFLVISAGLNIVLDLVFIILGHMGVAGAAWATNLSQAISSVLCLFYIYRKTPVLTPTRSHWHLNGSDTKNQLNIGIPMALQFAITASGAMFMQSAINLFGSLAVAAFTAASKISNLVTQGMIALGQTMATYAGQNFGRGELGRIQQGVHAALKIAVIYSLAAMVVFFLLLPVLLGVFFSGDVSTAELLPWAKTYVYECIIFFIPLSTIFIFRNVMQGCGFGLLPMLGGVAELLARVIVAFIAIRIHSYPLACFCDPAAWIAASAFTGIAYLYVMRSLKRRMAR